MVSSYSDFIEGEEIVHGVSKTILESENHQFCLLTMNHHPLHTNHVFAENTIFGKPVVVGTLVFSISVGITVEDISSGCIANLGYEDVIHHLPVFCGDTIKCKTTVIDKRLTKSSPNRGVVAVKTKVENQHNELVLSFQRTMLFEV